IQYTGNDGGIFNKYRVRGGDTFEDTFEEVNTEPILGSSPRWVLAAPGIGIGVYASAEVEASAEGAGADFMDVERAAKIDVLDVVVEELMSVPMLGSAHRWVLVAPGIGIGVYASAEVEASAEGAGADFIDVKSTAKIAVLDLDNPDIIRQTKFIIPFTAEQTK